MSQIENSFQLERPLVGFRTWYTRPLVPRSTLLGSAVGIGNVAQSPKPLALYPMTAEAPWTTGVNKAVCQKDDRQATIKMEHTSPHADCTCGLHAYVGPDHDSESQWITHLFDKDLMVTGAVLMWGTIYGGPKVIRAEFAEVVALVDERNISKIIAEKYKVPCISQAHMIYLATEHGDRVSPELERAIQERTKAEAQDFPKDFPAAT